MTSELIKYPVVIDEFYLTRIVDSDGWAVATARTAELAAELVRVMNAYHAIEQAPTPPDKEFNGWLIDINELLTGKHCRSPWEVSQNRRKELIMELQEKAKVHPAPVAASGEPSAAAMEAARRWFESVAEVTDGELARIIDAAFAAERAKAAELVQKWINLNQITERERDELRDQVSSLLDTGSAYKRRAEAAECGPSPVAAQPDPSESAVRLAVSAVCRKHGFAFGALTARDKALGCEIARLTADRSGAAAQIENLLREVEQYNTATENQRLRIEAVERERDEARAEVEKWKTRSDDHLTAWEHKRDRVKELEAEVEKAKASYDHEVTRANTNWYAWQGADHRVKELEAELHHNRAPNGESSLNNFAKWRESESTIAQLRDRVNELEAEAEKWKSMSKRGVFVGDERNKEITQLRADLDEAVGLLEAIKNAFGEYARENIDSRYCYSISGVTLKRAFSLVTIYLAHQV